MYKLKNENQLNNLKVENKKNLEQENKSNNLQLDKERQTYRDQFEMTKESQEKELNHQNNQFRDTFQERQNQMSRNFSAQERVFNRELFKQKLNWSDKFKPFETQKEDPFYKLIDPKSEFNETDTAYILKTHIPSYDEKSIHINVQKDKVSVQGNHSFKDELNDEQRKVASQQYQSFREEFQFSHPVVEKAIFQEREGDIVTVTIPKLLSSHKKSSRDLA